MLLALLAAVVPRVHATDVLVPEATPRDLSDFAVASLFTQMVVDAVTEEGVDLEDAERIRRWAGKDAEGCYDTEDCPANLWSRTDARLAVVMSVGQAAGGLEVDVRLHGADEEAPFKVLRETVGPGAEQAFAAVVARAVRDALPLLPERLPPVAAIVLEDDVVKGDAPPKPRPPADLPQDELDATPVKPRPVERDPDARTSFPVADEAEERRRLGVPKGAYARYKDSGLSREDWRRKAKVRSGRAHLEVGGGWGLGDVDRGYGVRVRLDAVGDSFETGATSTWEGAGAGAGATGWFAVGYAPTWFLETSIAGGVQWGKKYLNTGWECAEPETCTDPSSEYTHDAVDAVEALVEPRARIYFVATGPVKPYLLAAFTLRLHDGVAVKDLQFVDYPDAPGGASYGPTGGVGLMVDPTSRFSLFVEAPFTWLLSPAGTSVSGAGVTQTPASLDAAGYHLRIVGGIGVRL